MAVVVQTPNPQALLEAIRLAIRQGKVETWSLDPDGDFTHSPEQWRHKAWFRPRVADGRIVFRILTPKNAVLSTATYAVYHGRFIEMLLAHFDSQFGLASATALASEGDLVRG
jgi:hypothetical protein